AGTQTTLNASNSYTGATTLQSGTLQISLDSALSSSLNSPTGGIKFNGGTLSFNNYTSNLSFNTTNTTTGNVNLGSSGTSTLTGSINTTGSFTYYSQGGTLTLAGTTLNYPGATNVQNGTLILGAAAPSLPSNTSLVMGDSNNDSPTLDLNGHN